jgi:hypothetical protein
MLNYFSPKNKIHKINPDLQNRMKAAQDNLVERSFSNAHEFLEKVVDDLKIDVPLAKSLRSAPCDSITGLDHGELVNYWIKVLQAADLAAHAIPNHALNLAQQTQLVHAFDDPENALEQVEARVESVVNGFPKTASDIECGKNRGDVIDPYILAATQFLMCSGNFETAIGHMVAHKALMMIEGLMGHLHEDVLGIMRGNVRVPEPQGKGNKEILDPILNPFPGADVVQPPWSESRGLRIHQIKSKTGSAKGGDGRRLGEQLARLQSLYGGQIYYHALIGNTLVGHRSKAGVEKAAKDVVVLVGDASFKELTGSNHGPQLLLRVYQAAFQTVAIRTGYEVENLAVQISQEFKEKAQAHDDGYLEAILSSTVGGSPEEQDSRLFRKTNAKKKTKKRRTKKGK